MLLIVKWDEQIWNFLSFETKSEVELEIQLYERMIFYPRCPRVDSSSSFQSRWVFASFVRGATGGHFIYPSEKRKIFIILWEKQKIKKHTNYVFHIHNKYHKTGDAKSGKDLVEGPPTNFLSNLFPRIIISQGKVSWTLVCRPQTY